MVWSLPTSPLSYVLIPPGIPVPPFSKHSQTPSTTGVLHLLVSAGWNTDSLPGKLLFSLLGPAQIPLLGSLPSSQVSVPATSPVCSSSPAGRPATENWLPPGRAKGSLATLHPVRCLQPNWRLPTPTPPRTPSSFALWLPGNFFPLSSWFRTGFLWDPALFRLDVPPALGRRPFPFPL